MAFKFNKRVILAVVVTVVLAGFVVFIYRGEPRLQNINEVTVTTPFFPPKIIGDNAFYQNLLLQFSVIYPKDLKIKEYEQGNASTIVFQNEDSGLGFEVFVVPYEDSQVTQERLKMDLPFGIIRDSVEITVDGARAMKFYSKNELIGDTLEIWFIKDGFLYEVSTYRELEEWLMKIISTWQFVNIVRPSLRE